MSSAMLSNAAASRRPFIFDAEAEPEAGPLSTASGRQELLKSARVLQSTVKNAQSRIPPASITPASQLEIRPAPEMVSSGILELNALTGGLPRGCLTEICGPASSGRTTVLLATLAAATGRGEFCALIDASDALDPHSLVATGVDLDRLLWVRCGETSPTRNDSSPLMAGSGTGKNKNQELTSQANLKFDRNLGQSERRLEQVLRATDLLLESGGFGLIILDLADLPQQTTRRIPLTTWFRFRRAVEYKPTILLAIEQQPIAGSCSSLLLQLGLSTQYPVLSSSRSSLEAGDRKQLAAQKSKPSHSQLLSKVEIHAELIYSRLERKPARSVIFESRTAWAG